MKRTDIQVPEVRTITLESNSPELKPQLNPQSSETKERTRTTETPTITIDQSTPGPSSRMNPHADIARPHTQTRNHESRANGGREHYIFSPPFCVQKPGKVATRISAQRKELYESNHSSHPPLNSNNTPIPFPHPT